MTNRKILYGYVIQNGDIVANEEEAMVVDRVFALYAEGLSYQKVADTLNGDGVPFSAEAPLWNKHKVKRLLENPRYTGGDGYPPIVGKDIFLAVQTQIHDKNAARTTREKQPIMLIRQCLRCEGCGGRLLGMGGKGQVADILRLKCESCGTMVTIPQAELLEEVSRQVHEHVAPCEAAYQPSGEVVRLANAINRGLENPESPEEGISLILRGAAARYDCCPAFLQQKFAGRLPTVDWNHIRQAVSYITISVDNTVTAVFR